MYSLPKNYVINKNPKYCDRPEESNNWQIAQYKLASSLCSHFNISNIIDIGAGNGVKTKSYFSQNKHAIEYGPNYDLCKQQIENTHQIDINQKFSLPLVENAGIICVDVIEHLSNPLHLLTAISNYDYSFLFISTVERDLLHGACNLGPPTNPCHTMEWNLMEWQLLLGSFNINAMYGLIGNEGKVNCMYAIDSKISSKHSGLGQLIRSLS